MRLLALPSWLEAWDLDYVLVDGWERRGVDFDRPPLVVLGHHTATPLTARNRRLDLPTLPILRDGRPKPNPLAGPLCQVGLGRSGLVHVVASGKANHAGAGRWRGLPGGREYDVAVSSRTVGIEAEHPGDSTPWPQVQLDAYDRLGACLLWGLGQEAEAYCGHREWALPVGRKPDPHGIHLPGQRERIGWLLQLGPRPATPPPAPILEEDPVASFIFNSEGKAYWRDGGDTIHVPLVSDLQRLFAAGVKDVGVLSPQLTARLLEAAKQ